MRNPSYIVKNHNDIYYFRYVIPKTDLHLFPNNNREFRRSLKTRSRSEALKRAKIYWVRIMSSSQSSEMDITAWENKVRRGKKILDELSIFDNNYSDQNNPQYIDSRYKDEYLSHLTDYDIHCLELADKQLTAQPVHDVTITDNDIQTSNQSLIDVFEKYLLQKGAIEPKTLQGYRRHFQLFIEISNVSNIHDVTAESVRTYKDTIPLLPPSIKQDNRYKAKSIEQILKLNITPMSFKTMKINITTTKSFLKWLSAQMYVDNDLSGILDNIKSHTKTKDSEYRSVFSPSDLNKLFSSNEYQVDCFRKRSDRYWVMLLSLFTGARINELCQLLTKDIYKSDGVYVIDINDGDNKKVKTKSAVRVIPIHKTLIALGFIEYLEVISKHNHTKLFPTLKPDKNRNCARHISRFFNEKYKKSSGFAIHCGIEKHTDKGVKVFHSFRHTFINQWKQQNLNTSIIKQLAGHSSSDITMDRYGKDTPMNTVAKELNKIDFGVETLPRKWHKSYY